MIALDSNIVLRFLVKTSPRLTERAIQLIETNQCFITHLVVLEVCQVLESSYACTDSDLVGYLRLLLRTTHIQIEDSRRVEQALVWIEQGMEYADALVLCSAGAEKKVATFDKAFAKIAARLKTVPTVSLELP